VQASITHTASSDHLYAATAMWQLVVRQQHAPAKARGPTYATTVILLIIIVHTKKWLPTAYLYLLPVTLYAISATCAGDPDINNVNMLRRLIVCSLNPNAIHILQIQLPPHRARRTVHICSCHIDTKWTWATLSYAATGSCSKPRAHSRPRA
jgi:hypothetical protein